MDTTLILLVAPIAVAEIALKIFALVNLYRRPAAQVRGPKAAWATAILLVSLFGWIAYFIFGRDES